MDSHVELKNHDLFSTRRHLIIARFFLFVTEVRKISTMINDLNLKAGVLFFFEGGGEKSLKWNDLSRENGVSVVMLLLVCSLAHLIADTIQKHGYYLYA